MTIKISHHIKFSMLEHAKSCYPNECCGFIIGHSIETSDGSDSVKGLYYMPCNNRQQHNTRRRFLIDPDAYQEAEDEADERGQRIISIVHSHPNHSDLPSEFDRTHAWPGLSYIIISVYDGRVHSYNSWRLTDDRTRFEEENIIRGDA